MIDAREAFLPTDQGRSGDGFLIEACQSENRPLGSISPSGLDAALGGELNVIPDQSNNCKYYGLTGSVGIVDAPGMEGHVEVGNTTTMATLTSMIQ